VGGAELTCSRVVTMRQLLKETLAIVGRDLLQLAYISHKMEIRGLFTSIFLVLPWEPDTLPLFWLYV
jgi:hypothetical protein